MAQMLPWVSLEEDYNIQPAVLPNGVKRMTEKPMVGNVVYFYDSYNGLYSKGKVLHIKPFDKSTVPEISKHKYPDYLVTVKTTYGTRRLSDKALYKNPIGVPEVREYGPVEAFIRQYGQPNKETLELLRGMSKAHAERIFYNYGEARRKEFEENLRKAEGDKKLIDAIRKRAAAQDEITLAKQRSICSHPYAIQTSEGPICGKCGANLTGIYKQRAQSAKLDADIRKASIEAAQKRESELATAEKMDRIGVQKIYKCPMCKQRYFDPLLLATHMSQKHKVKFKSKYKLGRVFYCPSDRRWFPTKEEYMEHFKGEPHYGKIPPWAVQPKTVWYKDLYQRGDPETAWIKRPKLTKEDQEAYRKLMLTMNPVSKKTKHSNKLGLGLIVVAGIAALTYFNSRGGGPDELDILERLDNKLPKEDWE